MSHYQYYYFTIISKLSVTIHSIGACSSPGYPFVLTFCDTCPCSPWFLKKVRSKQSYCVAVHWLSDIVTITLWQVYRPVKLSNPKFSQKCHFITVGLSPCDKVSPFDYFCVWSRVSHNIQCLGQFTCESRRHWNVREGFASPRGPSARELRVEDRVPR